MRRFRLTGLSALVVMGAFLLPLQASSGSTAAVAFPRATPPKLKQLAELGASSTPGGFFGASVAISGKTAIVGAQGQDHDAGRAYVFTATAKGWKQTAVLRGSGTVSGDYFGYSVAVSGSTAVVGAWGYQNNAGRAYVFTKTSRGGWKQTTLVGKDTVAGDYFGYSVAISGTTVVVGAWAHANKAGAAYVFTKTSRGGWKQTAQLADAAGEFFGHSVAISGGVAVVGAYGAATDGGAAYVFTKSATSWKPAPELVGKDTVAGDYFGWSVAVSGTVVVVGAWGHANSAGRAYVFTKSATSWKQAPELVGKDTVTGDDFGYSVGVFGRIALVGAYGHDFNAGRAYLFEA